MNYKDILSRAVKTFIQAFLAVFLAQLTVGVLGDMNALLALAQSASLAGLAALISFLQNRFLVK